VGTKTHLAKINVNGFHASKKYRKMLIINDLDLIALEIKKLKRNGYLACDYFRQVFSLPAFILQRLELNLYLFYSPFTVRMYQINTGIERVSRKGNEKISVYCLLHY
jgi:hypothetical protein